MKNNTELPNELNEEQLTSKKQWIEPHLEVFTIESGPAFGSEASPGFQS